MISRSALQSVEAIGMQRQLKIDMCVDLGESLNAEADRKADHAAPGQTLVLVLT